MFSLFLPNFVTALVKDSFFGNMCPGICTFSICKVNNFFSNNSCCFKIFGIILDNLSISDKIAQTALSMLPFNPLPTQLDVLEAASRFAAGGNPNGVFVLNGYAGTGKTSLVGALIRAMDKLRRPVVLLAPTGRAAKVASSFSGHRASTIHRRIYRPLSSGGRERSWFVAQNNARDTLFIVDEASLISDSGHAGQKGLLEILVRYVYSAPGCRIMFVGDVAQLPPVGQQASTSMDAARLHALGLDAECHVLDIPLRQVAGSGIIHNATAVRLCLETPPPDGVPAFDISGYSDMEVVSSAELADKLNDSFSEVGSDETLVITRSNRRANDFNRAVRNMVMFAEEPLERGDRVVVSKNDYFWARKNKLNTLIANGDSAEITWVGKTEKMYGRFFTEVEMRMSDGTPVSALVMLRSLVCDGPSLPVAEMERFHNVVLNSYEGEFSEKLAGAMSDPYYNALQLKYAYCVTCHKAQGGQWKHVYIDMGGITPDAIGPEFYRWLYTAMTRATEKVFLINPSILKIDH